MISRAAAEAAFARAVAENPARAGVQAAAVRNATLGIAVGKAAIAMAQGAGPIARGLVVTPAGAHGELPAGWTHMTASHPAPDATSVAAGAAVAALVDDATDGDVVLALVSGGASALIEQPRVPLGEFRALLAAVMAAGAPIADLNAVRAALSELKAGQLAQRCAGTVVTLVASDVVGDPLDVIGSGPTIAADREALRRRARAILERLGLAVPAVLDTAIAPAAARPHDRAQLVAPLAAFARIVARELALPVHEPPLTGDVGEVARALAAEAGAFVAYGEPTVRVPPAHGQGGRARQLALLLARELRGGSRSALVAGTDGVDGAEAVAGAFVDGATWDALADPDGALARCDSGTALAQIGAQFVTGPTGVNHADVVIVG